MKRKPSLVRGVGINDSTYDIYKREIVNGQRKQVWICPYYNKWSKMLTRCYNDAYQRKMPSYKGCTVCDEWLTFSSFKIWMESQDWEGMQLDKDILLPGNKHYCPDLCVFVPQKLNAFLVDCAASRGEFPIGVSKCTHDKGKFESRCWNPFSGKQERIGYFKTAEEAHIAWRVRKHGIACMYADMQTDERIAKALRSRFIC